MKTTNMQKTAKEIIEETAAFYNSSNRAVNGNGGCNYVLTGDNGEILSCAVGRCMTEEALKVLGTCPEDVWDLLSSAKIAFKSVLESYDKQYVMDYILKPEYRGHCPAFWKELQQLHDDEFSWSKTGLNAKGLYRLKDLLSRWT